MRVSNPNTNRCCATTPITSTTLVSYILASVAALRAMSTTLVEDNELAQTLGYYTVGDGGGNLFYYDEDGSDTDDGGTVIKPTDVGSGLGRWKVIS